MINVIFPICALTILGSYKHSDFLHCRYCFCANILVECVGSPILPHEVQLWLAIVFSHGSDYDADSNFRSEIVWW
jgi:hypothetical protein